MNGSLRVGMVALAATLVIAVAAKSVAAQSESDSRVIPYYGVTNRTPRLPRDAEPPTWRRIGHATATEETPSYSVSDPDSVCGSCTPPPAETPAEPPPPTLLGQWGERNIDPLFEAALGWKDGLTPKNRLSVPVKVGAWHWYHESLVSSNDGYGIRGLRGTYWWEVIVDPKYDLGEGRAIGAHVNYRLRDGDFFRSFFDSKFWSYELYGYYETPQLGKLKAGQVWKRFGLDWDGVFFGNVAYFDGFKLDPDYGVSWEKTTTINDKLKLDSFAQFFFHEDGVNGSFGGADAESVVGVNEENTGVVRLVPTWTLGEGETLALGVSGLLGQINSRRRALIADQTVGAWAVDATYTRGKWKVFGEVLQSYGKINPARFTSGGPSNRLTDFLVGAHYTVGPVTYRTSYSLGLDDNPSSEHNMLLAGATIKLTKNVDLYIEYINEFVDGNAASDHIQFFNSLDFIIYWSY